MMKRNNFFLILTVICILNSILAQGITLENGITFSLGGATITNPGDFSNSGTVNADAAILSLTGNFTNNGVLEPGASTIIFNGTSNQTITGTSIINFKNITVNNSGGDIVLQSPIKVEGTLANTSGDVNLNGNNISLGTNAVLSETVGNTIKGLSGEILVSVSLNAPNNYNVAGMGMKITSAKNLGTTAITRLHNEQNQGSNKSILRTFDITPANNSELNATIVFTYDDSELNGLSETTLKLYRSTDNGVNWTRYPAQVDIAANSVTATEVAAFSRWTLAADFNSSPVGGDLNITIKEDEAYIFKNDDFEYSDVDGSEFAGIRIASLDTNGSLIYNGYKVSVASYCKDVSLLKFVPTNDQNGSPYCINSFLVYDGQSSSQTKYKMTINVLPEKDIPVSADKLISILEGDIYQFKSNDIFFDDADGDTLSGIIFTGLVNKGNMFCDGNNVIKDTLYKDIGTISFVPDNDGTGNPYTKFLFKLQDSSGDISLEHCVTFRVYAELDAPVSSDTSITINEDQVYQFNKSDFAFYDIDGHSFEGIRLSSTEKRGTLKYGEQDVKININYDNIGELRYFPNKNEFGNNYDSFTFRVYDKSGQLSDSTYVMTINVNPENDAPEFINLPEFISIGNDSSYSFCLWSCVYDVESKPASFAYEFLSDEERITLNYNEENGFVTVYPTELWFGETEITIVVKDDSLKVEELIQVFISEKITSSEEDQNLPDNYNLSQNYPNPFNPATVISYALPRRSYTEINIYNISGELVENLYSGDQNAGFYNISWNAGKLSSGIYFYRMIATSEGNKSYFVDTKKMILVK